MEFIDSEHFCHIFGNLFAVTGEHNGLFDARFMKVGNGFCSIFFDNVSDNNVPKIRIIGTYVKDGANELARFTHHAIFTHKGIVTNKNMLSIDRGAHAMTALFVGVNDGALIDVVVIGFFK